MTGYTLNSLPYDLRHTIIHEGGLGPFDLLCLSAVNQAWREVAIQDEAFDKWHQVGSLTSTFRSRLF